jgi:hypothetical protein
VVAIDKLLAELDDALRKTAEGESANAYLLTAVGKLAQAVKDLFAEL